MMFDSYLNHDSFKARPTPFLLVSTNLILSFSKASFLPNLLVLSLEPLSAITIETDALLAS